LVQTEQDRVPVKGTPVVLMG